MTITNQHQRKITAARLAEFQEKLTELKAAQPGGAKQAAGHRLAVAHTESYIAEFSKEIAEFDQLAGVDRIAVARLENLGDALVRARVASGLTQAELAERVGLKTSAINRYEANGYRSANLNRLAEVAAGLDFDLEATFLRRAG